MATTRVVFVDDEPQALAALERALRAERGAWEMTFTADPERALGELARSPDGVLVTDWRMPAMDGLSLCARARARAAEDGGRGHVYAIVLTGEGGSDDAARALDAGADDFVKKPVDPRELVARIRVGERLLASERALRAANERLLVLATTDALTGAANRRHALELLGAELARVTRQLGHVSVLMLDLDHFKRVNDERGHAAGDQALVAVCARARALLRGYDRLARWGGEEFLVVCPATGSDQAARVGERLRRAVADEPIPVDGPGPPLSITVSVGVASTDQAPVAGCDELVARADRALYEAKRRGRDRVEAWSPPVPGPDEGVGR